MISSRQSISSACVRNKLYIVLSFLTTIVRVCQLLLQTRETVGYVIHKNVEIFCSIRRIPRQNLQYNQVEYLNNHLKFISFESTVTFFRVSTRWANSGLCRSTSTRSSSSTIDDNLDENSDLVDDGNSENSIEERRRRTKRHKYWVLLVDDEEAIRLAVGRYLYESGYQVTACSDSDAAIEVLNVAWNKNIEKQRRRKVSSSNNNNRSKLPDIIVLDIRMPGSTMNGIELLQWIRSNYDDKLFQTIPIIMLTAKGLTQDRIVGYKAGVTAYLTKPFNPMELLSIVDNAILRNEQIKYSTSTKVITGSKDYNDTQSNVRNVIATPVALVEMKNDIDTIKEMIQQLPQNRIKMTDIYLTPAEREVLEYLGRGLTKQEIATARNVTTVQSITRIMSNLYKKTNLSTRTGLIRWAIETGYLPKQQKRLPKL